MLYHADGRTTVVDTPAAHDALGKQGWAQTPSAIHTAPKPTPSAVPMGSDPVVALMRATLEAVLDERGLTAANMAKLLPVADDDPPPQVTLPSRRR